MKLKLAELRERSGATRRKVCAAVDITEPTLAAYEKGETMPPLHVAGRLADFYNVSTDYILGREPAGAKGSES